MFAGRSWRDNLDNRKETKDSANQLNRAKPTGASGASRKMKGRKRVCDLQVGFYIYNDPSDYRSIDTGGVTRVSPAGK